MGSKKGEGGHYLPDNPSVTAFAVTAPFTQGSLGGETWGQLKRSA